MYVNSIRDLCPKLNLHVDRMTYPIHHSPLSVTDPPGAPTTALATTLRIPTSARLATRTLVALPKPTPCHAISCPMQVSSMIPCFGGKRSVFHLAVLSISVLTPHHHGSVYASSGRPLVPDVLLRRPRHSFVRFLGNPVQGYPPANSLPSVFRTNHDDVTINETSSYVDLAPLYGVNQENQNKVRVFDGRGLLHPDVFSEDRLLLLPPAVCVLLVLFNRNHNVRVPPCLHSARPSLICPSCHSVHRQETLGDQ